MTPRERWLQRVLHARGVRPMGHAEPAEDQDDPAAPVAPVIPVQPQQPAPGWPPTGTRTARISTTSGPGTLPPPGSTRPPDWVAAAFEESDRKDAEAAEAANATDDEDPVEDVDDEGQDDEDDEEEAPTAPPVPAGAKPVRKKAPGRAGGGGGRKAAKDDPSLRIAAFNLSAAAVGYMTPLAGIMNTYLVFAEQAARGVMAFVLAAGAAFGSWWITRHPAVKPILPYPFIARPLIIAGCAEMARRFAPVPVAWLNANGKEWGLGPDAVSLLITSGGISFALWWFVDRRLRRFHWVVRWVFRIPLATAVVATLRYGNPIH
ncbi:hypothetical protein ACFV27_00745 [Streptomyces antimycoticus]|uniref:hypothetical protein n=1 Tax=Streptomyces antimycoticus TaxID=68175 RepID=UPI0036A5FCF5